MSYSLKQAAERLGLKHRELMQRMRAKGLLTNANLPANPAATKLYLVTREYRYFHPDHGMQYPRSTRVTDAGLRWLEQKLGIERALPPPTPDRRDVA